MTSDKPPQASGPPTSVLASRLAPEPDGPVPTFDDLGLNTAKTAGFEWQQQRSKASWNELVATTKGGAASDWVREIHGMFGVIGEQVLLATEAEVEKAIAQARLAALPMDKDASRAALSRSLRFFAEGQANALVVAAHGLANLALRTLALDPGFAVEDLKSAGVAKADFVPRSEAKGAWVSLTAETCSAFEAAAAAYDPKMLALARELTAVQSDPAVSGLFALRNVQYHRWRGESPGVTRVNLKGATMREQLDQGQAVGISSQMLPVYKEGQHSLDDVVVAGREALDALVARMPGFHQAWYEAFGAVFG